MQRPETSLSLENVSFAYRKDPVLRGISLRVADGEMIGIVGPNGSGKSTLLSIMAGLTAPDGGELRLFDKPMRGYTRREAARYIAYVPQETPIAFGYTVGDFVMMGRRPYHGLLPFETERDARLTREAMHETDTEKFASRSLFALSGGERQRVLIAAALAQEPSVLLLDEPTASLDLHYQIQIHSILRRLNRERTITVVVVTHDLNMAALFFRRVIMLSEGRVIADGAPENVLTAQRIREVYRVEVTAARHPDGTPMLVPLPSEKVER